MQALPAGGAMVALEATEDEVAPLLAGQEAAVALAAVNGERSVVASGTTAAVASIAEHFTGLGRRTRRLRVSHAFHSPLMDPMLDDFRDVVRKLEFRPPAVPVVSSVTGALQDDAEWRSPEYWARQVRDTVRFHDVTRALRKAGVTAQFELGPDAALTAMADADEGALPTVAALRRDQPETRALVTALARLHARGVPVDWAAFFAGRDARRVPLPTYAFQRRHYWLRPKPGAAATTGAAGLPTAGHPLLGAAVTVAGTGTLLLTGRLGLDTHPWLADHAVGGAVLVPGTALLELALHAASRLEATTRTALAVGELVLQAPLILPATGGVRVQVVVDGPDDDGRCAFRVVSQPESADADAWTTHADGVIGAEEPTAADEPGAQGESGSSWPPAGSTPVDTDSLYADFAAGGFAYGPAFQGVRRAWRHGDEVYAEVVLPEPVAGAADFALHPALADAALHAAVFAGGPFAEAAGQARLPFVWDGVTLHATGATALRVRITPTGPDGFALALADPTGTPVATIRSLTVRAAPDLAAPAPAAASTDDLHLPGWEAVPLPAEPAAPADRWALVGDPGRLPDLPRAARHPDPAAAARNADQIVLALDAALPPGTEPGDTDAVAAVHTVTAEALDTVRRRLADSADGGAARLIVLTAGRRTCRGRGGRPRSGGRRRVGAAAFRRAREPRPDRRRRLGR